MKRPITAFILAFTWLIYGWPAGYMAGELLAGRQDHFGFAVALIVWGGGLSIAFSWVTYLCERKERV